MAAPAATAGPAMASLGATLGGIGASRATGGTSLGFSGLRGGVRGREGLHSELSFCYGRVCCRTLMIGRRNFVSGRGLRGGSSSSGLIGARVRRLMMASRHLTYAVLVSTESSVLVKAGESEALPSERNKPVMTLQSPDRKAAEYDAVGLKPPPLKPAPKPVSRSNGSGTARGEAIGGEDEDSVALKPPPRPAARPSGIGNSRQSGGSGEESDSVTLKSPPRPALRRNNSSLARPQQSQGSESPSLGQILESVEKLGPGDAGPVPRGGGRGPVRARPLTTQPGAWRAGDKIRSKEERERDAAVAAESAAAERRLERADNGDAQASTSSTDSDIVRTQRPRMQLNTLAKPIARPAPAVPRKGPVLKDVGSSGTVLRDVGGGPILKDVGAAPRSQSSGSSASAPRNADINAGPAGPPKPFSKPAIKVNFVICDSCYCVLSVGTSCCINSVHKSCTDVCLKSKRAWNSMCKGLTRWSI